MTSVAHGKPRDALAYHGDLPFSAWGSVWKMLYDDLPPLAVYDIYDQCVRHTGGIPLPPLALATGWADKHFRIVKVEGTHVVALYRYGDKYSLIHANRETYEKWCAKKQRTPNEPPFPGSV